MSITATEEKEVKPSPEWQSMVLNRKGNLIYMMASIISDMQSANDAVEKETYTRALYALDPDYYRQHEGIDEELDLSGLADDFDSTKIMKDKFDPLLLRLNALSRAYTGFKAAANDYAKSVKDLDSREG